MLVRLLGKEYTAQKGSWNIPFTDVPEWTKPYVGHAYENGLTEGEYNENTTSFTRGDVAIISVSALATNMKGNDATLGDFFYEIFDRKEIIHRKEAEAFQYIIDAQDGMNESLNNIPNYIDTNEELASYLVMTILEYQRYVNQSIAALYYGISECGQSMENKEIKQYLNELIAALIPLRDFPASEGNVEKFPEIRDNALQRIEEVIDKYEEEFSLWDILS